MAVSITRWIGLDWIGLGWLGLDDLDWLALVMIVGLGGLLPLLIRLNCLSQLARN